MMKRVMFTGLSLAFSMSLMAQDVMEDGSKVVLPLEAQQCDLPSAPPPIPDPAEKGELIQAKKKVQQFQADMIVYRECLDKYDVGEELTTGNHQAISNAHNYSVEMEERVAGIFNEALRAYKARLAEQSNN